MGNRKGTSFDCNIFKRLKKILTILHHKLVLLPKISHSNCGESRGWDHPLQQTTVHGREDTPTTIKRVRLEGSKATKILVKKLPEFIHGERQTLPNRWSVYLRDSSSSSRVSQCPLPAHHPFDAPTFLGRCLLWGTCLSWKISPKDSAR